MVSDELGRVTIRVTENRRLDETYHRHPEKARPPDSGIASRTEIVKLWRVLQQGDRPWEIETNNARNRKNPKNRRFQNRRPEQKTRPTTLWAFFFALTCLPLGHRAFGQS